MLAIRMQRLGRKGHPTYRVVVQDVRQTPTSGKYVAMLGSYDPHSKATTLVKDKAEFYLTHGAQPSERVARLFTSEGITLPSWVKQPSDHTRTIRTPDKLRKNRPAEEKPAEEPAAETTEEPAAVESAETETAVEEPAEVAESNSETDISSNPTEETAAEVPSEESAEVGPETNEPVAEEAASEDTTDAESPKKA